MQIGELARRGGVSVRAVRYYEELGLLQPEAHSQGGFRLYGEGNLKRLCLINFLKEAGLSLTEIRQIVSARQLSGGDRQAVEFLLRIFREKLAVVESKLEALGSMKMELTGALRILDSCKNCNHPVLLDAIGCGNCSKLDTAEELPRTLDVILH